MSAESASGASGASGPGDASSIAVDLVVEQLRARVPGGIGTYCRGLVQGLVSLGALERDVAVFLVASRQRSGSGRSGDPLGSYGLPLRTSRLSHAALTSLWDRGIACGPTSGQRADLVHATSFQFPPSRRAPVVVTVHDLAWRQLPDAYPPRGRAWHEAALSRAARVAEAFVTPSRATAEDLLGAGLGVEPGRVHVIEHGADHLGAPDHEGATALLEQHGVRGSYLLSVGTREPRKNLERVVSAYALARSRLDDVPDLVVVGPAGWELASAGMSHTASGVVPVGTVSEAVLSALYENALVVAYVPLVEGFGLPAVEAMACGAPVVVSRGLPGAASDGYAVDPLDVESIADGLVQVGADEVLRARLVSKGEARAAALRWRDCAASHVALWRELRTVRAVRASDRR